MKKILIAVILLGLISCKYNDDYLNPKLESKAYFASNLEYTRTVIVGEGMQFKIGAAASGSLQSPVGQTVDMIIDKSAALGDGKKLIPDTYYNSTELKDIIKATIGDNFLGYFTVKIDSVNFLNDPLSLDGNYTIPVKIVNTSLQSINEERDKVQVSVKYMSKVDGYYLYTSNIKREINGIIDGWNITEKYPNESDNSTYRLETTEPFKVKVTPAVNSFLNDISFELIVVDDNSVSFNSLINHPEIIAVGENKYDKKPGILR